MKKQKKYKVAECFVRGEQPWQRKKQKDAYKKEMEAVVARMKLLS